MDTNMSLDVTHRRHPDRKFLCVASCRELVLLQENGQRIIAHGGDLLPACPDVVKVFEDYVVLEDFLCYILQTKEPYGMYFESEFIIDLLDKYVEAIADAPNLLKEAVQVFQDCLERTNCPMNAVVLLVAGELPYVSARIGESPRMGMLRVACDSMDRLGYIVVLQPLLKKSRLEVL